MLHGHTFTAKLATTNLVFDIANREDLENAIDAVVARKPMLHAITACIHVGACPAGLFSPLSIQTVKLHGLIQSGRWPWAGGWMDQPAFFARACEVIDSETSMIAAEDRAMAKAKEKQGK